MDMSSVVRNRRKFPRFATKTDTYVLYSHFGRIVNISMGGALFMYFDAERDSIVNDSPAQGVLFARDDEYLVEIPCKTVYDSVEEIVSGGKSRSIVKRAVAFAVLNSIQADQLAQFILGNVNGPLVWENCL